MDNTHCLEFNLYPAEFLKINLYTFHFLNVHFWGCQDENMKLVSKQNKACL